MIPEDRFRYVYRMSGIYRMNRTDFRRYLEEFIAWRRGERVVEPDPAFHGTYVCMVDFESGAEDALTAALSSLETA